MAHSKSAEKRARQNEKQRIRRKSIGAALKTQIKKFQAAVEARDADAARAEYKRAVSAVDKAAKRGICHPSNAARQKSQLTRLLAKLQ